MKFTNIIYMMAILSVVVQSMSTNDCINLRKKAVAIEKNFEEYRQEKLKG